MLPHLRLPAAVIAVTGGAVISKVGPRFSQHVGRGRDRVGGLPRTARHSEMTQLARHKAFERGGRVPGTNSMLHQHDHRSGYAYHNQHDKCETDLQELSHPSSSSTAPGVWGYG